MKEYSQQGSRIREQFRKQIRRKEIDRMFSQKRKQLLQQLSSGKQQLMKNEIHCQSGNQNPTPTAQKYTKICNKCLSNPTALTKQDINQLTAISTTTTGLGIILAGPIQLLNFLISQFMLKEKYFDTQELQQVLLIINNVLVASNNQSQEQDQSKNMQINLLTSKQIFVLRIFTLCLDSKKKSIRQTATTIIFCLIWNNQPSFTLNLIINPKYLMMNLFFNQMHNQPPKDLVLQTLRCYYLAIRKLNFQALQPFGRLRKYIFMVIQNSNCLQLTMLAVICLYALLKSLPKQRLFVSSSKILLTIYSQALSLNNSRLAINALRISSYIYQNKNEQQIKKLIQFIQAVLFKFGNYELQGLSFKILYDIILKQYYSAQKLVDEHPTMFQKMIQMLENTTLQKFTLIELCFCFCLIIAKNHKLNQQIIIRIKEKIKFILENVQIDQPSKNFIEQSISYVDNNYIVPE